METGFAALKRATHHLGGCSAVARVVGVTPQAVSEKIRRGKSASPEWCLPIERATDGKVSRHDLRPDLYPQDDEADA